MENCLVGYLVGPLGLVRMFYPYVFQMGTSFSNLTKGSQLAKLKIIFQDNYMLVPQNSECKKSCSIYFQILFVSKGKNSKQKTNKQTHKKTKIKTKQNKTKTQKKATKQNKTKLSLLNFRQFLKN